MRVDEVEEVVGEEVWDLAKPVKPEGGSERRTPVWGSSRPDAGTSTAGSCEAMVDMSCRSALLMRPPCAKGDDAQ